MRFGELVRTHRVTLLRAGAAALALVTIAAIVGAPVVRELAPAVGGAPEPAVTGHPQRIGHQWWVRELPERPGPAAALVQISKEDSYRWEVMTADGHRWKLPTYGMEFYPALSGQGRYVGYLAGRSGPYVIHDLVTGQRIEFPEVGSGYPDGLGYRQRYGFAEQWPSFWSPDQRHLLVPVVRLSDTRFGAVLLGRDGSLRFIDTSILRFPAGWAGPDQLVWLEHVADDPFQVVDVIARVTDLAGDPVRQVPLRPGAPWGQLAGQWAGVTAPTGQQLSIWERGWSGDGQVRRFSLATGMETAAPVPVTDLPSVCPTGWAGTRVTVPGQEHTPPEPGWPNVGTALVDGQEVSRQVVLIEPRLGVGCLLWADAALADAVPATTGPWGWSATWWWRELVAGLGLVVLAWWAARRRQHRRSGRSGAGRVEDPLEQAPARQAC